MSRTVSSDMPWGRAAAAGAAAWIVGVIVMFVLLQVGTLGRMGSALVESLPLAGSTAFYAAIHIWFLGGGGLGGSELALYMIVPAIILVLAGFMTARQSGIRTAADGFKHGAIVSFGYLVLLVISAFLLISQVGSSSGGGVSGQQLLNLAIIGIIYPVVFGGIGGAVAASR